MADTFNPEGTKPCSHPEGHNYYLEGREIVYVAYECKIDPESGDIEARADSYMAADQVDYLGYNLECERCHDIIEVYDDAVTFY